MFEFLEFWMAKFLVELGLIVLFILISIIVVIVWHIPEWFKQSTCKHEEYYENMACHAICRKCHMDLGFIGNLRGDK